ncbi:MAG: extracellular solute-binding protein [Patescibacteria group bacterium]|nr:extracellular solute-binding protein [Patescibacteria group bacterium]
MNNKIKNFNQPPSKKNSLGPIIIALIIVVLAATAYFLYPQLFGHKKSAQENHITPAAPVTITYISNQPLVDAGDGAVNRLNNIINTFTKQTGINVERVIPPQSVVTYSDIGLYLKDTLKSGQSVFDITMVDGPWTGMFAPYLLDLTPYFKDRLKDFFPDLIANATVDERLVAMPYFQDMTVLFYRTDLLEKYGYENPPQTWDELEQMAKVIQSGERKTNSKFWGYVWAANESESLTCTALGLQASYGGGTIIDNGKITVNNPEAIKAFTKATGWIGTISPVSVLQSSESDILTTWQNGNAAFMQSWPGSFAMGANSVISGDYQITALPSGGFKHSGVYGGEYLGIDKRTAHPKEAAMFLQYLSSPAVQKERAREDLWSPVLPALYSDPDLAKAQPVYEFISSDIFSQGVARPGSQAGNVYDQLANAYFSDIHAILAKQISAPAGLAKLESQLHEITGLPIATK